MMTYPGPSSDEEEYGNLNATQDLRSNLVILAYAENNFPAGMKKAASRTALRLAGSDHEQCPLNVFIQPRWPFWELWLPRDFRGSGPMPSSGPTRVILSRACQGLWVLGNTTQSSTQNTAGTPTILNRCTMLNIQYKHSYHTLHYALIVRLNMSFIFTHNIIGLWQLSMFYWI